MQPLANMDPDGMTAAPEAELLDRIARLEIENGRLRARVAELEASGIRLQRNDSAFEGLEYALNTAPVYKRVGYGLAKSWVRVR